MAETRSLGPWQELVGVVSRITDCTVTLRCRSDVTLDVGEGDLTKWKRLLGKGASVGILRLDDGSFRARLVKPRLDHVHETPSMEKHQV